MNVRIGALIGLAVSGAILASSFLTHDEGASLFTAFDKGVEIDPEAHAHLMRFLETGIFRDGDIQLDASPVQKITVEHGRLEFDPPLDVKWKFIRSTVSDATVDRDENHVFIDINNSPIDVLVTPRED